MTLALDGRRRAMLAEMGLPVDWPQRPDGRIVRHVPMPDPMTTKICFGGPELKTAYVTLSGSGNLVAFEWDRAGLRLNHQ